MYTYVHITPYSCTHTLTDTEVPALFSAEASLLWDKEERVQTLWKSILASVSPMLPRESSLLPLTPLSSGSWTLDTGTAARILGLCCCRVLGNPSTGLPPLLLLLMIFVSASAAQAPTSLHPRLESSEKTGGKMGRGSFFSQALLRGQFTAASRSFSLLPKMNLMSNQIILPISP